MPESIVKCLQIHKQRVVRGAAKIPRLNVRKTRWRSQDRSTEWQFLYWFCSENTLCIPCYCGRYDLKFQITVGLMVRGDLAKSLSSIVKGKIQIYIIWGRHCTSKPTQTNHFRNPFRATLCPHKCEFFSSCPVKWIGQVQMELENLHLRIV